MGGSDRVTDLCQRAYPWFLSVYLGTAPYYYVPGVPDDVVSALKTLCFLLAAGITSVAALSSGSFRTPGGLPGPLGFAVLAVLSLPGVLQGNLHWSADYAADLVHAAAFCWLFFWIVRSGEDLRRILVPALAILYGILAIQVVSMLAASDWHWSRLCGFSEDDPFRLYNTPDGTPAVIGLWLPAGALLFARRPAWSPWLAGAGFLLTALVLAAQLMATSRIEMLLTAGLAAALLLRREIRAWAAGMLLGFALAAAVAMVSFTVFGDNSCFYHLDLDQQAPLFGDEPPPAQEEPLPPRGEQPHPPERAVADYPFTATGGVTVDEGMGNGTRNATVHFKADNHNPSGASRALAGQIIPAAPGVTISRTALDLREGGQGSYTVVLDAQPTGDVTVRARSSDPGRAVLTNATLTFTRDNWNAPQTIGVNSSQDADIFHDVIAIFHTVSSSYAAYGPGLPIAEVTVKVNDDDAPSPDYEPVDIRVTPGDGTLNVTWKASPRPGVNDGEIRYGLRWSQTPYVWANPKAGQGIPVPPGATEYTIEGLRNGVAAGVYVRSFTVSGGVEIDGSSSSWVRLKGVSTTPVGALPPGLVITPTSATIPQAALDLDEGGQGIYTVVLNAQPTGDVTVRARSSDPGRVALSNATLTFTRNNWNVPQTIGVKSSQDAGIFHDVIAISHTASSSDAAYGSTLPIAEVTVKVNDDEAPSPDYEPVGIQVTPGDGTLKVAWKANPRPGMSDGEIRYGLRWSQTPYVWANPPAQCSATAEDGISVPPGTTEYTIEGLRNGVATGVYVRSFTVSGGAEADGSSSSWVRLKGVKTTPAASLARSPTLSPPQQRKASSEAGLSALRVADTFLEPSFNPGVTAYTGCEVPFRVTSTHVTATVKDTGRATVKAGLRGALKSAVSGRASGPVQLSEGPNVIDIVVTAEDGVTRRTYTVTVEREASPADIAVNPGPPPSPSRLPEGSDSAVMERWMVATSDRLRHFLIAFDLIGERPLLGHGFGTAEAKVTEDLEIHNLWLKFAAYTGALWPTWFALMVGFLLYRGGQLLRRDLGRCDALLASACAAILASALLLSMTSPGFFIGPANINTVIWVAAGIILGLHSRLNATSAAGSEGRTTLGRRLRAMIP